MDKRFSFFVVFMAIYAGCICLLAATKYATDIWSVLYTLIASFMFTAAFFFGKD